MAAFLRGRTAVRGARALPRRGSLHPTTTLWFAVWLAVATIVVAAAWRMAGAAIAVAAAAVVAWLGVAHPARSPAGLTLMDAEWLAALADKDYLFPLRWPLARVAR